MWILKMTCDNDVFAVAFNEESEAMLGGFVASLYENLDSDMFSYEVFEAKNFIP